MSFKQELTAAYHEMLNIKVSLGYKQRTYMSHILPFIEFCADSYPDAKEITKEMLDHWLLTKNFNADSTRRIAIINIRHFARFLNAIGKKAYIPPSHIYRLQSTMSRHSGICHTFLPMKSWYSFLIRLTL